MRKAALIFVIAAWATRDTQRFRTHSAQIGEDSHTTHDVYNPIRTYSSFLRYVPAIQTYIIHVHVYDSSLTPLPSFSLFKILNITR